MNLYAHLNLKTKTKMKSKFKYITIMPTPSPTRSEIVKFFKSDIKEYHDIKNAEIKRRNKTHQTTTK